MQFTDSASSLSNLVNNLSNEIHRIKCKFRHNDKKCEACRIKYKYCDCFAEYTNFKENLIEYKFLVCIKNRETKFDEKLNKRLMHTNFLTLIKISLFFSCRKVFILVNIRMIG